MTATLMAGTGVTDKAETNGHAGAAGEARRADDPRPAGGGVLGASLPRRALREVAQQVSAGSRAPTWTSATRTSSASGCR